MVTTKNMEYPSSFTRGMAVNRGLMNAINGGTTKAHDLEKEMERKA